MDISRSSQPNHSTAFRRPQPSAPPPPVPAQATNPFAAPTSGGASGLPIHSQAAYVTTPRTPWWQREGAVGKVLALTGCAVTLIGVVMLLVIAANAGLLSPQLRVGGGAVLSLALIAIGIRTDRRVGGRTGAVALTVTGTAGLFFCVVAATTHYAWLAQPVGLALAGVVAAAVVTLAVRWNSQLLAALVIAAVAVLAPVLTGGLTLTLGWFLIVLQAAGLVPERMRGWAVLGVVRTVPAVLALSVAFALDQPTTLADSAPALVVAAVGLASVLLSRRESDAEIDALAAVMSYLPLMVMVALLAQPSALLVGPSAAGVTVAGVLAGRPVGLIRRGSVLLPAALLVVESGYAYLNGSWLPAVLMGAALLLTALARRFETKALAGLALAVAGIGACVYLAYASPAALSDPGIADRALGMPTIVGGLLLAGWSVVAVGPTARLLGASAQLTGLCTGTAGLYGATAAILSFGTLVAATPGFEVSHLGVSLVWAALSITVLAAGLHYPQFAKTLLGAGLTLAGAAVAKLFLYDLGALGGATRAAAFIGVGLLLLFAGSRYAQAFAGRGDSDGTAEQQPPVAVA